MDEHIKKIVDEAKENEGLIRWRGCCEWCGDFFVSEYADVSRLHGAMRATRQCVNGCGEVVMRPAVIHFGEWIYCDN